MQPRLCGCGDGEGNFVIKRLIKILYKKGNTMVNSIVCEEKRERERERMETKLKMYHHSPLIVEPKGLKSSLSLPTLLLFPSEVESESESSELSPLSSPSSLELSTAESLPPGLDESSLSDMNGSLSSGKTVVRGLRTALFLFRQLRGRVGSLSRRLQSMFASAEAGAGKCLRMSVSRTPLQ